MKTITLYELITQAVAGGFPAGRMMIDNDCWTYCADGGENWEIDPTEPGLLKLLTDCGIKWEHV